MTNTESIRSSLKTLIKLLENGIEAIEDKIPTEEDELEEKFKQWQSFVSDAHLQCQFGMFNEGDVVVSLAWLAGNKPEFGGYGDDDYFFFSLDDMCKFYMTEIWNATVDDEKGEAERRAEVLITKLRAVADKLEMGVVNIKAKT